MDAALISKKELLDRCGISYGALYRWKRMGLIPEDWFLRRSTPTGQETFFYRDQILPRMELILSRSASLDALAAELNDDERKAPQRVLILRDHYKQYRFALDELEQLVLVEGGKEKDLLEGLKGEVL